MRYYGIKEEDEQYVNWLFEQNQNENSAVNVESKAEDNQIKGEHRYATNQTSHNKRYDDDDFWNLGETRRKVYKKPDFGDKPDETTLVDKVTEDTSGVKREAIPKAPDVLAKTSSKLYNRPADNTSMDKKPAVRTSRYKAPKTDVRELVRQQNEALRTMETIKDYSCENLLIRRVEIKPWTTNIQFYQRFAAEAAASHIKAGEPCEPVQFFAYVPQYSKMNDKQQRYYLYVRDSIRNGSYPEADMSYILLYIYEIINIPNLIPPDEGVRLLAAIWLNYRDAYPRLDVFLCEWLPDYCLIHQVNMPRELEPILPQIVQKAQFKEFYLDVLPENIDCGIKNIASALLEFSSDYDYRRSRYYAGNEAEYDEKIKGALYAVISAEYHEKRGIFDFDKKYRLTRDAYCGAVTPAEIKRRIDIEFYSFTRPLETRKIITDLVKYTENKLRAVLKIKAKLGSVEINPADQAIIDKFFAPLIPEKSSKKSEEEEYLKYYEAESSGFDFGAAEEIERISWNNTNMLTDTDSAENKPDTDYLSAETTADVTPAYINNEAYEENKAAEQNSIYPFPAPADASAIDADVPENTVNSDFSTEFTASADSTNASFSADEDTTATAVNGDFPAERDALAAAVSGNFRQWCRANGYYDSDMASRINEIFFDIVGDIVISAETGEYEIIDDYREDVLNWLS